MERIRVRTILAVAVTATFVCALNVYAFLGSISFLTSGQIQAYVTAASGSVSDIQEAVDEAISRGIVGVKIPSGNWTFAANGRYPDAGTYVEITVPTQGLTIKGAGADQTILDMPDDVMTATTNMFYIVGGYASGGVWNAGGKLRISGITFRGRHLTPTRDVALWLAGCKDFRIDHCNFYDMGNCGISVDDHFVQYGITGGDPARVSQGVIDHNGFYDIFKQAVNNLGYGVALMRAEHYSWEVWDANIWNVLGVYDKNVFIENNYFAGCRHAVACSNAGVYVFRHNLVENGANTEASLTGHPVRQDLYGMRAYEVYDNIFRTSGQGTEFHGPLCKAGGGVVFNNTWQNLNCGFILGNVEYYNPDFYPRGNVKELYIWGNSALNCTHVFLHLSPYVNPSTGWTAPVAIEGTDWFSDLTGAYTTSQMQILLDSLNYEPYTYPHPLTL